MANSFTFLYPYIDKMVQEVDFENLAPLKVFDKDLEPAGGLTGRIPRTFDSAAAAAFTPTMYIESGNSGTVSGINYSVDQCYEVNFQLKYNEGLAMGSRMNEVVGAWTQQGVRTILKAMVSGLYASGVVGSLYSPGVSNCVGSPGTTPLATPWADIINVNTALERNMCPQDGRVGVLDLAAWSNCLNATGLTNFYASNTDATLRRAAVGRLFNFDVVMDQLVPTRSRSGSGHTGDFVFSGTIAKGDTSMYMVKSGGITGGYPIPGDIFYVTGIDGTSATGYGQSYVITSGTTFGDTGVGNGILQYFYPTFRGSGTTLSTLQWYTGLCRQNLFGHKSAIRLIMRDPRQGMAGMPQLGQSVLYVDPRTGVPLLITFVPGNGMVTVQIKALWTWVVIKPEWCCIMAG